MNLGRGDTIQSVALGALQLLRVPSGVFIPRPFVNMKFESRVPVFDPLQGLPSAYLHFPRMGGRKQGGGEPGGTRVKDTVDHISPGTSVAQSTMLTVKRKV